MNRKGTREQNDISIITNLPKRLQKRIVEDFGDDSLIADDTDNPNDGDRPSTSTGCNVATAATPRKTGNEYLSEQFLHKQQSSARKMIEENLESDVTGIDFFLKRIEPSVNADASSNNFSYKEKSDPVLEASGTTINNSNSAKCNTRSCNPREGYVAIPGILRLNDSKQVKLVTEEKNNVEEKSGIQEKNKKVDRRFTLYKNQLPKSREVLSSPVRHLHHQPKAPPWFEMVTDIQYTGHLTEAYEKVTSIMQRNIVIEKWSAFTEARNALQQIFAKLLLQQLKLCCEQKIDTFFWKLLYYNVREYFKTNSKSHLDGTHNQLLVLIDEGLDFYTKLHMELNAKYIDIVHQHSNNLAQEKISSQRSTHKFEFIAKVAAQKLLICLGDLCRYKAKELQSNDLKEAAKYYQQAQSLIPTNGIPYNQMAIVAINERKKFDAVYFHMRSLKSSNAIYSARESLLVLFDEIRKKYEENELKTSPLRQTSPRLSNLKSSKPQVRKEVWIHEDGVRRLHRFSKSDDNRGRNILINEENRLVELDTEELLRRFTSLYLYVIGKLYTGIGMETIIEHQRKLLVQLNILLKRSTFPVKRSRLIRIVALNIFIIEHNMHKDSRREIRYYTFNFCNQIFGLLLSKCNTLIATSNMDVLDVLANNVDLNTFLQYINIYTSWLACNVDIWESLRKKEHAIVETWSEWERCYQWLKRLVNKSPENILENIMLEEELYLLGFTPLTTSTVTTNLNKINDVDSENIKFLARIFKISKFQDVFEKNKACLLICDDTFSLEELNGAMQNVLYSVQSDEDDNTENIVTNGTETCLKGINEPVKITITEDTQISQLSKRRKELEAKTNVKKQYNAKLDEILKFVDSKLYIEVRPRYLMPDTNCFIDCLEDFQKLINDFKRYVLVIPLTVVKELDGLSKGVKVESYQNSLQLHRIHHYDDVSTCAKRSLDFIRTAKNNIKCATTKGSFINSSLFALAEEEHVSNDDKILATAVALSKTMSTETNKDGKCFIQTELVLITTDRNLRVKALARNLTVSEMSEFLQWVKDCNT